MLRWVLLIVSLSAVSAAQNQRIPVVQTLEMLRSANDALTRVARFGGGSLAFFLPVLLCIGFFAFIIPLVAILFVGTGTFSGGGGGGAGPGWGGSAGLYPAGRNLAEMIPGLPLTNEQLVQAMTFLDKAVSELGARVASPPTQAANSSTSKKRTHSPKSLDQGPNPAPTPTPATTSSPTAEGD